MYAGMLAARLRRGARDDLGMVAALPIPDASNADVHAPPRVGHVLSAAGALAFLAFIAYGSLVPLGFVDKPLHEALAAFLPPAWYSLGPEARADWIANLVLYVAAAFLALWATNDGCAKTEWGRSLATLAALAVFATTLEFIQIFFPPRTVSLNDLAAEWTGIVIGALVWALAGSAVVELVHAAIRDRRSRWRAVAAGAIAGYLFLTLFPFDIVISSQEWQQRLASGRVAPWLGKQSCQGSVGCLARWAAHVVGGGVLGLAWYAFRGREVPRWSAAVAGGLLAAIALELAQLPIMSANAEGSSLVAHALGFALGFRYAARVSSSITWTLGQRDVVAWLVAAAAVYVLVLFVANGIHRARPLAMAEVAARFDTLRWVPLYYHYYVDEARALLSTMTQFAMYAPVGVLLALAAIATRPFRFGAAWAALLATFVALFVETAKLFTTRRPDPTDLWLAAIAGASAYAMTLWLMRHPRHRGRCDAGVASLLPHGARIFGPWSILGVTALAFAAWGAARQPVLAGWIAAGMVCYAVVLLRWPGAWLVVLPALLPVLDLTQWTGRLSVDEFDLFVLVTLGVVACLPPRQALHRSSLTLVVLGGLWLVSTVISMAHALVPLPPLDPDTFWNLQSPASALRAGRATLWVASLIALASRWSDGREDDLERFAQGMTLGLLGTGIAVLWEQYAFATLLPDEAYRASGMFSAISTAGAQIESFLAAGSAFAIFLVSRARTTAWRAIALASLVLAVYAAAATISRTAILGVALAALIAIGGEIRAPSLERRLVPRSAVVALLFVAGLIALTATSSATLGRFVTSSPDLNERFAHWKAVLTEDLSYGAWWAGWGLGAYPGWYFWRAAPEERPPLYSYRASGERTFVRVAPGNGVFLDQVVAANPGGSYRVEALLESDSDTSLQVALCEKWILNATACSHVKLLVEGGRGWQRVDAQVDAPASGRDRWPIFQPTMKLSLAGAGTAPVNVTDLRLVDTRGQNLIRNGDFQRSGTHWFVSADEHWPWNTFNLGVEVMFEQGIAGVTLLVLLISTTLLHLWRLQAVNLPGAGAWLGAIAGFLFPACFDAVIDDPRMRFLFMLLVAIPLLWTVHKAAPARVS